MGDGGHEIGRECGHEVGCVGGSEFGHAGGHIVAGVALPGKTWSNTDAYFRDQNS